MCPFINNTDARCANYLNFRNVFQAFSHCADRYTSCPIYQQLSSEGHGHDSDEGVWPMLAAAS